MLLTVDCKSHVKVTLGDQIGEIKTGEKVIQLSIRNAVCFLQLNELSRLIIKQLPA